MEQSSLLLIFKKVSCFCFYLGMYKNQYVTYFLPTALRSLSKAPCSSLQFWSFPSLPGSKPPSGYSCQTLFYCVVLCSGTNKCSLLDQDLNTQLDPPESDDAACLTLCPPLLNFSFQSSQYLNCLPWKSYFHSYVHSVNIY